MAHRTLISIVSLAIASAASAQDAVQWRVEDGGNGHWYGVREEGRISWETARTLAEDLGGHLATLTSAAESSFVGGIQVTHRGILLGAYQDHAAPDYREPIGGWRWVTGESWEFTNWQPNEPNNNGGVEDYLAFGKTAIFGDRWNDGEMFCPNCEPPYTAVEWSADCNSDGIVDYGQILVGDLEDANANNIPDCCEEGVSCEPCIGDITGGGVVDGTDLAAMLSAWGTTGEGKFDTDVNDDGVVDGSDLATLLNGWGACP